MFLRKPPSFDPACVLLIHLDGKPILERLVPRLAGSQSGVRANGGR